MCVYVCIKKFASHPRKAIGALGVGVRKRKQNGPLSSLLFWPLAESKRSLPRSHQVQPSSPRERSYKTLSQRPGRNPDPWFPNIYVEGVLKHRISDSVGPGWERRICITSRFSEVLMLLVQGPHLENLCSGGLPHPLLPPRCTLPWPWVLPRPYCSDLLNCL